MPEAARGARVAGRVVESLPNALFRVELEHRGPQVLAHLAAEVRAFCGSCRGTRYWCELSPYDPGRGRIVRGKSEQREVG